MITILHRLVAGLGRVLIMAGALVLAFAAFQYWGTGVAESRAQARLDGEFRTQLASVRGGRDPDVGTVDLDTIDDGDDGEADQDESSVPVTGSAGTPLAERSAPMPDLPDIPGVGEAAGRIIIPAIGLDKTYVQGVGRDDLRKGPGHYPLTAFPGQAGNAAIAGHRTTYGAPFHDLDELSPGDEIVVETLQGRFTYHVEGHEADDGTVVGHFIVDPTATWVLEDRGDSRLTLTACHPKRSAAQRIVVTAVLDTPPAPPTPAVAETVAVDHDPDPVHSEPVEAVDRAFDSDDMIVDQTPSLDESLGWQLEHWPATTFWGALSAVVATAGWLLGRRWGRVPVYAAAAGPFLACLFLCFSHLDKLLPAI